MCSNVSSTTMQSWRERSPSSYSLKIQNFSQLENSTLSSKSNEKYQSRLFSSGGYNWSMIIYPKGNDKDNGSGFLSMYVEIDSTSLMSKPQTEVFADVRFFVFNKNVNKYITIQDVESKRFNTLKTVWGLPQVLPLDTFSDPNNGYVFEGDQCEFGVDVIVAPPPANWDILSFNEKFPCPKFHWILKNFSELKELVYTSSILPVGGRKWFLSLYPNGESAKTDGESAKVDDERVSIYLILADNETLREDEKVFAQAQLRLLDPFGHDHVTVELKDWHIKSNPGWGHRHFMSRTELQKAYLGKKDTLTIEIEFEVVSETKCSPII
ncbi:PREDICTED: uncharacterized protein LOC109130987 [Camelina sativa]|uniref:Uncharacterized protein LOC109130987 n=1 Tax=Camelina sativa TaxID=90675 RepID=A0ABM1RCQ7_CAMSA|nr:PREDICTED: uncharacterized protein LOC109130987 [Camelina sativa]